MKKLIILILLVFFIIFFVGFIDVGYEHSNIHIFLKYPPTINLYFFCPDGLVEQAVSSAELIYYEHYLNIWESMGIWSDLIPFVGIQLFLTILFSSYSVKYNYKYFIADFVLFIVSLVIIAFTIKFALYENSTGWYIFLFVIILLLNYFIWNKIRVFIFKQFG